MDVDLGRVAEFYSEIIATCACVCVRVRLREYVGVCGGGGEGGEVCVRARAQGKCLYSPLPRAEVIESGDELNNGATECCKWIGSRGLLQRRVGNKRIGTKGSVSDRGYCGKVG